MKKDLKKKCKLLVSSIMFALVANAQSDRIHIGLVGGIHSTSTKFSNLPSFFNDPKSVMSPAFGAYAEFELGNHRSFSLRPQLTLLSRGTEIKDIAYIQGGYGQLDYKLNAKYTDLRVPIMYYFGQAGKVRPYVYVAPVLGFVRGGKITAEDDANKESIDVSSANMASTYFAVTPGIGVKIPLGGVDLGLEANYEIGLVDTYGSKEKNGKAIAHNFFPVYKIEGTRKFTGFEFVAHLSIPLSIFKSKPHKSKIKQQYAAEKMVQIKQKPCYTIEEILTIMNQGGSIEGLTICAIDLINFEYDKSTLTRNSRVYLDKIADLIKRSGISMEVKGHTDNSGSDEYNMNLSKRRAEAVYNYLISKGVSRQRLSFSYYGKTQPIESNETEQGRRMNRRVEFEIK